MTLHIVRPSYQNKVVCHRGTILPEITRLQYLSSFISRHNKSNITHCIELGNNILREPQRQELNLIENIGTLLTCDGDNFSEVNTDAISRTSRPSRCVESNRIMKWRPALRDSEIDAGLRDNVGATVPKSRARVIRPVHLLDMTTHVASNWGIM